MAAATYVCPRTDGSAEQTLTGAYAVEATASASRRSPDILCGVATLIPDANDLVLRLSRLEKLGALHGDARVPRDAVEDVAVSQEPFRELRGMRAPGTGFPGRIALGTWRHRDGKDFVALYRDKPAVIVRLRDAPFRRLLVSVDDPEAVAARLRDAAA
jgi:hypothetical protein